MRHDQHASQARSSWFVRGISALLLAAPAGLAAAAPASEIPPEQGVWFNNSGKGAVEIRPCAETGRAANYLCGFIVWLKDPNNSKGQPLTDGYNQDPRKRTRPICGLPVLGYLRPMSDGSWDQGWVYDPEQGKQFDAAIQLRAPDRLILTGYKGIKFFSKSFVWKRAPDDLPRCDNATNGAAAGSRTPAKVVQVSATAAPPLPFRKAALVGTTDEAPLTPPRPVLAVRPTTAAR